MGSKKRLETIDLDTLDLVKGGAYTAASLSSHQLKPVTQPVMLPGAGRSAGNGGTPAGRTPPMGT